MAMTQENTDITMPDIKQSKKRKSPSQSHEIQTITIKAPPFSYIHLSLITTPGVPTPNPSNIDILTFRTYLTAALTQFLGITGSAIPVDILKNQGRDIWIRVPREDCSAVVAAVGGWTMEEKGTGGEVGWRLRGKTNWLGELVGRQGVDAVWGN